jgi:ACS family D-galactonate transporter-like MFS transporter
MTATYQAADDMPAPSPIARLWQRQLNRYPNNGMRFLSLFIVVATTVVLYYQLYLSGGVAVQILGDLHMSFLYFVNISVIGYAFGALASVIAGLADRYGRANIVTAGLLVTGVLSLAVLPHIHTELPFAITYVAIGFVEGIVLVATPALIRDFSPQLGRASAMGGWTLGPVLGSLVVAVVVTNTSSHTWQWQYGLAGIVGLVVFAVAAVGLRELAPNLRDQLMVSQKDRALIEMRAKGLDIEESLKRPFRQMLKLDIVGSAFAISVFLIIYYIAVGFFPIFFETVFGYTQSSANGLGDYFWACDAGALLLVGIISDIVGVRKPFMILGAVGAIVFTSIFAVDATHNQPGNMTTHGTFVILLIGISVFLGIAFAPWMASFTETVERRNPALTATGLAVWGLVIRVVIAVVVVFVPHVVNTVSTIVDKGGAITAYKADPTPLTTAAGPTTVGGVVTAVVANAALVGQIQTDGAKYAAPLGVAAHLDSATAAALGANPSDAAAQVKALSEISGLPVGDVATVATLSATKPGAIAAATVLAGDPTTATALLANPADPTAGAKAVTDLVSALNVTPAVAIADLQQLATVPTADLLLLQADGTKITAAATALKSTATIPPAVATLFGVTAPKALGTANFAALTTSTNPELKTALAYLGAHGAAVNAALAKSPKQWRTYFFIGVGGEVVFIPLVFLMAGYWSPRKAKQAEQEHEAMVASEMAKLQGA